MLYIREKAMTLADSSKREVLNESGFGEHNMLIYSDLNTFREMYCMYAKIHLEPKYNEIVLIVTQYETPEKIRNSMKDYGIDVERHEEDGSLFIVDSVKGYQSGKDHAGVLNLAKSLVARAEKDGKAGVCVFGDIGSFFMFDRIAELLQYELSISPRPAFKLKAFCSYHAHNYRILTPIRKRRWKNKTIERFCPRIEQQAARWVRTILNTNLYFSL
jgi:hypothetical protein